MPFLQKQYNLETSKSKEEIFREIQNKIEAQREKNDFFGLDLVNYQNFKLKEDSVEIASLPITWINPYEGVGSILFKFCAGGKGTIINCTIEPSNKYASLAS